MDYGHFIHTLGTAKPRPPACVRFLGWSDDFVATSCAKTTGTWPWLLVITGYFNGVILIIHSINGVLLDLLVLITEVPAAVRIMSNRLT